MFSNQDDPSLRVNQSRSSGYSSSNEVDNRPKGDLKGKKDFKKILHDPSSSEELDSAEAAEELFDEELATDDSVSKKNSAPPRSIFNLSGTQNKKPSMLEETADAVKSTPTDSPSKLFSKLSSALDTKKPVSSSSGSSSALEEEEEVTEGTPLFSTKQEKDTTRFASEQQDLSYVNPLTISKASIDSAIVTSEKQAVPASNLQDLVNQMVKHVEEMALAGKTETRVTLQQPPLFANADLIVTEFDSAKGEFNVSFENLRNEAKALLDQPINREAFQQHLIDKGYTVHIIMTTTQIEDRPLLPTETQAERERGQGKQRQQKEQEGEA